MTGAAPIAALGSGRTWSNVDPAAHFAADYPGARAKFRTAAARIGLDVESHVHPSRTGPSGEELAIDLVVLGEPLASHALLITSATHGVEGFCGSGCQAGLLADAAFVASVRASGVAVLLLHALNPHGFAHLARTTEENADLNRNFRDLRTAVPNADYRALHAFLVPDSWPPTRDNEAQLMAHAARHGIAAMQQAITSGQSEYADGLFFTGERPAWSQTVLRGVFQRHLRSRERLGWIDLHTGLGPAGHGEKIFAGPDNAAMLGRVKSWWGHDVTSIHDGSSTSAKVAGSLFNAAIEECPASEYTGIALEFGTLPFMDVLNALRARQWLANHPAATPDQSQAILRQIRDAFYVDTPAWKAMVYAQTRVAAWQALGALGARATRAMR